MSQNTKLTVPAILILIILFFVVIFYQYDTTSRRIALEITVLSTTVAYIVLYIVFKKKYNIILPWFLSWIVVIGVWFDAIGNFMFCYHRFNWWDELSHLIGGLGTACVVYTILFFLNQKKKFRLSRFNLGLYTVSLTMLLASFYEITEYWGDSIFQMQRIGSRFDSPSDLMWGLMGSIIVVMLGNWEVKRRGIRKK